MINLIPMIKKNKAFNSTGSFQEAVKKSLLIHGVTLLILAIIPLSSRMTKPEYIEVSLLKGEKAQAKSLRIPRHPQGVVTKPKQVKKAAPSPAKKSVTKKITPAKPPKVQPQEQKVLPAKTSSKAQELADKTIEKQPTLNTRDQKNQTETVTQVSTANQALTQAVTGNLNLSGPITRRQVLHIVRPDYPAWAAEQGLETDVGLKFWVSPKGIVKKTKIIQRSGYLELDIIAKRALRQWLFDPLDARLPQKDQWGTVVIKYRLE